MCGLLSLFVSANRYLLVFLSFIFTFPWIQMHISSVVLFLSTFTSHSVQDSPLAILPKLLSTQWSFPLSHAILSAALLLCECS